MNETSPRRARKTVGGLALSLGAQVVVAVSQIACEGSVGGAGGPKDAAKLRNTAIEHEPCDAKGKRAEALDANADRKPEVLRVYDGNREACRVSDLNGDGKPNMSD